jgi:hypothetical protein
VLELMIAANVPVEDYPALSRREATKTSNIRLNLFAYFL